MTCALLSTPVGFRVHQLNTRIEHYFIKGRVWWSLYWVNYRSMGDLLYYTEKYHPQPYEVLANNDDCNFDLHEFEVWRTMGFDLLGEDRMSATRLSEIVAAIRENNIPLDRKDLIRVAVKLRAPW